VAKIAIFDSGFGSLSIIKPIQNATKAEIIYFADQKNFPYGEKSTKQLEKIINETINMLKKRFNPDLIIVGSNTPSILLQSMKKSKVIGVLPPLKEAKKKSKTANIAILATHAVVKNKKLRINFKNYQISNKIKIKFINISPLVNLVESGKFIDNQEFCKKIIKKILKKKIVNNNIDVATLSSTHLPFLLPILKNQFPNVIFLDPAIELAQKISKLTVNNPSRKNSMNIFTSGKPDIFQMYLHKIGIKNKVSFLSIP